MKKSLKYILQRDMELDFWSWPGMCAFGIGGPKEHSQMHRYGGKQVKKIENKRK